MQKTYVSTDTVIAALRILSGRRLKRTGRTTLMSFLMLKAKEPSLGTQFTVRSTGEQSVAGPLHAFFRIAPGTRRPDVNPFGKYNGALEFLTEGYERRGTYTHLYVGRNIGRTWTVSRSDGRVSLRIPEDAPSQISTELGAKVPLRATAAFLLRGIAFNDAATHSDLIERFKSTFHLLGKL